MDGLQYASPTLLVFILGYMIYTERKVTSLCAFIRQLPCQIVKKRRVRKCYKTSSTEKRSIAP